MSINKKGMIDVLFLESGNMSNPNEESDESFQGKIKIYNLNNNYFFLFINKYLFLSLLFINEVLPKESSLFNKPIKKNELKVFPNHFLIYMEIIRFINISFSFYI